MSSEHKGETNYCDYGWSDEDMNTDELPSVPVIPNHPIAELYQRAYRIGEHHIHHNKDALATPEVFVDTYFSDEDFAILSVEWGLTKRELFEVYKTGYRNGQHS